MRNGFEQDSKNLFTWGIYDMKNTLYVSDLDGTLFNSSKKATRNLQVLTNSPVKNLGASCLVIELTCPKTEKAI